MLFLFIYSSVLRINAKTTTAHYQNNHGIASLIIRVYRWLSAVIQKFLEKHFF